tara:strand:+ start:80 stop:331 length:252 start_codon:yes stop_codon:yes gene_type:complete
MLCLNNHNYYEDNFLKILNEKNITSPFEKNYDLINDYIFKGSDDYDKYRIISSTILFIDKLKSKLIVKSKKNKKKERDIFKMI